MKLSSALALRPVPEWLPDWVKPFEGLHDGDPATPILEPERDRVDGQREGARVGEERRDVLEHDALLGEVVHLADVALEAVH
jgi:hypothetical protein